MNRGQRRSPRARLTALAIAGGTLVLAGCGPAAAPSGIATNPPVAGGSPGSSPAGSGTPSPTAASGTRTVLSPLGLNIHATPLLTAPVLGTAAEGTTLTVVDKNDQNGGWYKVQGQTVTGWMVADPTLTAAGLFTSYQSTDRQFNVLIPQDWTFAEEPTDVLFHPTAGAQTIVVRNAAHVSDFGPYGSPGFAATGQETVVVCGVTGSLNEYTHGGAPPSTPTPGTAGALALLDQLRLKLDATHALAITYNYSTRADLQQLNDFLNSMTFPFPLCQAPPPAAASPSPT